MSDSAGFICLLGIAAAASRRFYRYEVTESDPPENPAGDLPAPISIDLKASATGALHAGSLPPRSVSIFHAASDADGRPVPPLGSCARERTQLRLLKPLSSRAVTPEERLARAVALPHAQESDRL